MNVDIIIFNNINFSLDISKKLLARGRIGVPAAKTVKRAFMDV